MEKIFVTRSSMPPFEDYMEEIRDIWESHHLTNMGPKHEKLRKQLESQMEVPHVELFTNGHAAIELTLAAMKLKGEVITTPFTFVSTTHAIVRNGLTPVFCDVNPVDYTMDVSKIEDLITEKTCAIMPVHVYGNICDVEAIERIAKKHNLKVIYDAAHAFGCKYKGKDVAGYGDASCFSFHATKVFNSIEGGCVAVRDDELQKQIYLIKNFGIQDEINIRLVGANGKMNEFCAAMGLCNLKYLKDNIYKRGLAVSRYRERLTGIAGVRLNPIQADVESNYSYFPVFFDPMVFGADRDRVAAVLAQHEIYARKYFYPLTNAISCYKDHYDCGDTPEALALSTSVLTLPLYSELTIKDVDRICDVILSLRK